MRSMDHTLPSLAFHGDRRKRLLQRLEQIRSTMMGEDVNILDLATDENGRHSAQEVDRLARRLCGHVDEIEKALLVYLMHFEDEGVDWLEGELDMADDQWRQVARDLRERKDGMTADLRELPMALSERQRELVYAFFYCCLQASLSPVGRDFRQILRATSALRNTRATLPNVWPTPLRLSHEDLLYSELSEAAMNHSAGAFVEPERDDVFCLLDAVYVALTEEDPSALDPPELVERVRQSNRFKETLETADDVADYYRTVERQEFYRELTGAGEAEWLAMSPAQRYARMLQDVDSCDEEVLRNSVRSWYSDFVADYNFFLEPMSFSFSTTLDQWEGMTHDERLQLIRLGARDLEREARYGQDHEDLWLQQLEDEYEDDIEARKRRIRSWLEMTGCADELLRQYRILRQGFFESYLPQCTHGGSLFSGERIPLPGSFGEVAETAVEMLLGDENMSRTMNDELYVQIYSYLDETKYRMDSFLLKEMLRRG